VRSNAELDEMEATVDRAARECGEAYYRWHVAHMGLLSARGYHTSEATNATGSNLDTAVWHLRCSKDIDTVIGSLHRCRPKCVLAEVADSTNPPPTPED
jgi:hypothetical protein